MRGSIFSVGCLLIGITLVATDIAAESGEAYGSLVCNAPGHELTWSVTWQEEPDPDVYQIVACYMPNYEYQSAQIFYLPGGSDTATSDGDESVPHVPQYENGHQLAGVYVWFEWGEWEYNHAWGLWFWYSSGATDWHYCPRIGSCFAAGTPLLTPEGSKPIEQFRAGDWILSSREDNPDAPAVARRVHEVIRSQGQLVAIAVNGQVVHATREHPYYVKGKGWTSAASLAISDLLRSHDDRWMPVQSIAELGKSPVYNVRVEEHNTYFVGGRDWDFSLWVYGACYMPKTPLEELVQSKPLRALLPSGIQHSLK